MATGSGLDAQIGFKNETTVGTANTPVTKFTAFDSADLTFDPSYLEGASLKAGIKFKSVNQVGIARRSATGKIQIPVQNKGFGFWWRHFIGSTATATVVPAGTLAFDQYHVPGGLRGNSFTTQVGKPEPGTGTVQPFTYNGCKVLDWNIALQDNAKVTCDFTVDAWDETNATGLATASYPTAAAQWDFSQANVFKIGGTASTSAGKTTMASGVAVTAVVTSISLSGKNNLANQRFGLGSAGSKKEQLENDYTSITGTFKAEYSSTNFVPQFIAGTTTALQFSLTGSIIESTTPFLLDFILPTVKITKAPVSVSGPDLVTVDGEFTVYDPDDGINPPIQVHIVSTDSTVL